jgi:hypothetical protein
MFLRFLYSMLSSMSSLDFPVCVAAAYYGAGIACFGESEPLLSAYTVRM